MKYKVGDAVRVKSLTEIKKTLDKHGMGKSEIFYSSKDMSNCCGCTHYIKRVEEKGYRLDGVCWLWAEEWLEPIKFKEGSFAVVRPDLISGDTYGSEVFIHDMIPTLGALVKIKSVDYVTDTYHIEENHWNYSPEMLLTLDEAFIPGRKVRNKNGTKFSNDSEIVTVQEVISDEVWFQETGTYQLMSELIILPEVDTLSVKTADDTETMILMKYAVGEKVRVKSFEEIQKTLDKDHHLKGEIIIFNPDMKSYCGNVYKIKSHSSIGYYLLENCRDATGTYWQWPKEWLEPLTKPIKFGLDLDYAIKVDSIKSSDDILTEWLNLFKDKKDYENQLQRKKTRVRGAEIPEGSRICSRKRKAAVIFGHLSNQARTGF